MTRRRLIWTGQLVLAGLVGLFVWQTLAARWGEFQALRVDLAWRPAWIAAAAGVVLLTYGLLIEAWRRILGGWAQPLAYRDAARIWTLSNLGRYVPGKIWGVAGLAVLARQVGVAGWAAAGSALVMQAVAVGTGVAVVAGAAPAALDPLWVGIAVLAAGGTAALLAWPWSVRQLARLLGRPELTPLSARALAAATGVTALSWVAYGVAFWCLARGLLGTTAAGLPLATAVGVFAGGYIVGLIALFAPGGLGVREVVFLGLLTPVLGAGGAVALAAGSRVLLTVTEIGAALAGLLLRRKEHASA